MRPRGKLNLLRQQVGSATSRHCGALQIAGVDRLDSAYRLFQQPLSIDIARQRAILLKRDDEADVPYDKHANVLLIELQHTDRAPYRARLLRNIKLHEVHEPLFIVPNDGPASLFASLAAPKDSFSIVEMSLEQDQPELVRREIHVDAKDSELPQSWIDRPALLLHDGGSPSLVLSRLVASEDGKGTTPNSDSIVLETMSLQREKLSDGAARWTSRAATRCEISYQFKNSDPKMACHHRHTAQSQFPTAINRLRGSQTLAGDLRGNGGTDIVIIDPCLAANPIILESAARDSGPGWTPAPEAAHVEGRLTRDVRACRPLTRSEIMSAK